MKTALLALVEPTPGSLPLRVGPAVWPIFLLLNLALVAPAAADGKCSRPVFVSEDAGVAHVLLQRFATLDKLVRADFSTEELDPNIGGGLRPAKAGVDYVATNGIVTFEPGQTDAVVDVRILDNGLLDGPRGFSLVLRNLPIELAYLGGRIVIEDNELSPIVDPSFQPEATVESFSGKYLGLSTVDGRTLEDLNNSADRRFYRSVIQP